MLVYWIINIKLFFLFQKSMLINVYGEQNNSIRMQKYRRIFLKNEDII